MFWHKTPALSKLPNIDLNNLNFNNIPVLRSRDIVDLLGLEPKLKSIEKLTASGAEYFDHLYRPAIEQFIESAQLVPASTAHHHAGPGGLIIHTLDVIDTSLRIRKSFNLPLQAPAEVISAQEHIWTYAIFSGAMLHDAGKLISNTRLLLDSGRIWTPHDTPIIDTGANTYRVVFEKSRYNAHTVLANGLIHILPTKGRGWLAQYPDILVQLTAWLAGDLYECGAIGEIVRQADGQSVARNLKLGGQDQRFPNAPTIPLVDRITTALRQLLDEDILRINRPEGSAGWTDEHYTYLVCGTVADAVRSALQRTGATDIPSDNTRLFDTWQEHGFVESTPDNRAIWYLTINNSLTLTVLKFETNRLFHPSRRPELFCGELSISADRPESSLRTGTANTLNSESGGSPTTTNLAESTSNASIQNQYSQSNGSTITQDRFPNAVTHSTINPEDFDTINTPKYANENVASLNAQDQPHGNIDHVKDFYMGRENEDITPLSSSDGLEKSLDMEDPDIAQHFLDWVRAGIRDGKIFVNRRDALVHIVKEGALIVSPLTFKKFVKAYGLVDYEKYNKKSEAETFAATALQRKLTKMMSKAKLHRKTKKGLNIHTYLIQGKEREVKIKGWLLPVNAIFGDTKPPSPNKVLVNISGFDDENKK